MSEHTIPTPAGFRKVRPVNGKWQFQIVDPAVQTVHDEVRKRLRQLYAPEGYPDQIACVRPHVRNRFLFKVDLHDAYGHTPAHTLLLLERHDRDVWYLVDGNWRCFFHEKKGLIRGASASNAIFDAVMKELVEPDLTELCKESNLIWTRYVDDFLFSTNRFIDRSLQRALCTIFERSGFPISRRKVRAVDTHRETLEHLGITFHRGNVSVPVKPLAELQNPATRAGRRNWEQRVLALNRGSR